MFSFATEIISHSAVNFKTIHTKQIVKMKTSSTNCRAACTIILCLILKQGAYCFAPAKNDIYVPRISSCTEHVKCIGTSNKHSVLKAAAGQDENSVEEVSLSGLGDDHEAVGENMSKSVAAWLDAEVRVLYMSKIE